jgi:hypothetical protein
MKQRRTKTMPTFNVHIVQMVSTVIEVEADSAEEAAETYFNAPTMPGSITIGAFGAGVSVSEAGEWEAAAVFDEDDNEVWTAESD